MHGENLALKHLHDEVSEPPHLAAVRFSAQKAEQVAGEEGHCPASHSDTLSPTFHMFSGPGQIFPVPEHRHL